MAREDIHLNKLYKNFFLYKSNIKIHHDPEQDLNKLIMNELTDMNYFIFLLFSSQESADTLGIAVF